MSNTAKSNGGSAPKPDPSVPLSAIRALVQQWREQAIRLHRDGNERDHVRESQSYCYGQEHAYQDCADQLAALCPAPPEDQA
jgi:hypothetical protein